MYRTIKLHEEIIDQARIFADINSRSIPKQIEYWIKIGKIAEENPDLSYSFIKDILLGLAEGKNKAKLSEYKFD